ncbi:MAG: biotin carboxyl carrier protein [Acidobacteriales bacterium]|nr:biotin carboxyl carrier protein [Terriglobales bacterium]
MTYDITVTAKDGQTQTFSVELSRAKDSDKLICRVNGEEFNPGLDSQNPERDVLSVLVGSRSYEIHRDGSNGEMQIQVGGTRYTVEVRDPRSLKARRAKAGATDGPKKISAPMPGKVVRIISPAGTEVEAGQGVIVIEAMKMQNELKSPKKGIVKKIMVAEGATVNAGDALAIIE